MSSDWILDRLRAAPVVAILRGLGADEAVRAAEEIWAAGVQLVEVSLAGEDALAALRAVCARATAVGSKAGAGTVCTPDDLNAACSAGADFAIAPGLDVATVEAAETRNLPFLPGAATPSEVQAALGLGCVAVKIFPADLLGPAWFGALRGPFPRARLVAVGGVTHANAQAFVEAGAVGVGMGSALEVGALAGLLRELRDAGRQV
jgi:2-dehydro-3-deoxyphosphogluconate aldolase / (4S)-4-hydroxy-2-oxoglutarate aldolase